MTGRSTPLTRLFAPGERLGWVFQDRRLRMQEFPERRPPLPVIHREPLDRLDRAETGLPGRVTRALVWGLLGTVLAGAGWYVYGLRSAVDLRVAAVSAAVPLLVGGLVAWSQLWRRRSAAEALEMHRLAVKDAYVDEVAAWQRRRDAFVARQLSEINRLDEWAAAPPPDGVRRLDVFGGTLAGWQGLLTVLGTSLLPGRPVTVVDLSREDVSAELGFLAARHGLTTATVALPADLPRCDLLAGLAPDEIVDVLVESMYHGTAEDRPSRSTDRLLLAAVCQALGGEVTIGRLVAGVQVLMREPGDASALRPAEREHIAEELFSDDYRRDAMASLRRIQSYLHPLRTLGSVRAAVPTAPLLRLVLSGGVRTAGSELLADLLVQWLVTRVTGGEQPAGSALIVVGADDLPPTRLSRLSDACERREVRLVNLFRQLREGGLRAVGGGAAGFMRLGNPEEAAAAADAIGREHRFVVSQITRTLSGGTSHSEGDSWARDWTRTVQHAEQTGWSDASSRQRVYEYVVEPRSLQSLPDYALVLVEHTLQGPALTAVECNPEIALLPRVSTAPRPPVRPPAGTGTVHGPAAAIPGAARAAAPIEPGRRLPAGLVSPRDFAGIEEA